ncbi:MAG: hypothetical protein JW821_04745 [Deltaproteobacteria bacterium]|nr:hypothetical protein [Deltaproteobacteria bacterium]
MRTVLAMIVAFLVGIGPAYAENVPALMERARTLYNFSKPLEAAQKLRECLIALWDQVPLTAVNVRIVKDTKDFAPRPDNVYKAAEHIFIHCELYGYGLKKTGEVYSVDIVTDLNVKDAQGNALGGKKEAGTFQVKSPMPVTEFSIDLDYSLPEAPAGLYDLETVIRDRNSAKTTQFTQRIEIR